jgi:hypothetical protein
MNQARFWEQCGTATETHDAVMWQLRCASPTTTNRAGCCATVFTPFATITRAASSPRAVCRRAGAEW